VGRACDPVCEGGSAVLNNYVPLLVMFVLAAGFVVADGHNSDQEKVGRP